MNMIKDTKLPRLKWNIKQNSFGLVCVFVPLYIQITKSTIHVSAHRASAVVCSFFCHG